MSRKLPNLAVALSALLLVAVLPAIVSAESPVPPPSDTMQGTIKLVDMAQGKLVLTVAGVDKTYSIDDSADITVDGKEATVADLAMGQSATVTSTIKDGGMKITRIVATKSR